MSSGLTETQYRSFTQAASLGSVEHTYLDTGGFLPFNMISVQVSCIIGIQIIDNVLICVHVKPYFSMVSVCISLLQMIYWYIQ